MKKPANKFDTHFIKPYRTYRVELSIVDQIVAFMIPGAALLDEMEGWTGKYTHKNFRNPDGAKGFILKGKIPDDIGGCIKHFRKEKMLTQVRLAELVDTTQANIASIESGARPVGKALAKKLGEALGVDYRTFL